MICYLRSMTLAVMILLLMLLGGEVHAQNADQVEIPKGQLNQAPDLQYKFIEPSDVSDTSQLSILFEDHFEDSRRWETTGSWSLSSSSKAVTNPSGEYLNAGDSQLITPSIKLPEISENDRLLLQIREKFRIESGYDSGDILISLKGSSVWKSLSSRSGRSDWRNYIVDVSAYSGKQVQIAFRLESDENIAYTGWQLEQVQLIKADSDLKIRQKKQRSLLRRVQSKAQALTTQINDVDPQNFPNIISNVVVDTSGTGISSLDKSNFTILEDGVPQTNNFEVTPPEESGNVRGVDVIFLMDNSLSMDEEQNAVRNNMISFVDSLEKSGVNYALGLCRFGADQNGGNPILADNGSLTSDASYFKNDVWSRNTIDGRFEPGWDALYESTSGFNFRPGAQQVFILITDETVTGDDNESTYTKAETKDILVEQNILNFSLLETSDTYSYPDYGEIAEATGGQVYDITNPFDSILDEIGAEAANTYVLNYRTSNDVQDGTEREVQVEVEYDGNTASDTANYFAGGHPQITRTPKTIALDDTSFAESTTFTISTYITDQASPNLQSAQVFFKTTSSQQYTSKDLTNVSDSTYQAEIPADSVNTPGFDYYITANDGQVTSSLPSINAGDNPFQIAVLPNKDPQISHTPVQSLSTGNPITIRASITDNTNKVDSAVVKYRQVGKPFYNSVKLQQQSGDTFEADIPAKDVTSKGVEYFIEAYDDFGVSSTEGTSDIPIQVKQQFAGWPDLENPSITIKVVAPSALNIDDAKLNTDNERGLFEMKTTRRRTVNTSQQDYTEIFLEKTSQQINSDFNLGTDEYDQIIIYDKNNNRVGYLPFVYKETDFDKGRGVDAIVYVHNEDKLQPDLDRERYSEWGYYEDNDHPVSMLVPPKGSVDSVNAQKADPVLLVHGVSGKYPYWGGNGAGSIDSLRILEEHLSEVGYDSWKFYYPENQNITKSGPLLGRALLKMQKNFGYGENSKIDLITHSMGGLVARHYIQGMDIDVRGLNLGKDRASYTSNYSYSENKNVGKFLMMGTPNNGSYGAYRCIGGSTSKCGFKEKATGGQDEGAPAFTQMTPGSKFLFKLNSTQETEVNALPEKTLVLAGSRNPYEGLSKIFKVKEITGQDDGAVAVSSASLLNFDIPLLVGDFTHSGSFDRDDQFDPRLTTSTEKIITHFLEQGVKNIEQQSKLINGFWENSELGPHPSNVSFDGEEGMLVFNIKGANRRIFNISNQCAICDLKISQYVNVGEKIGELINSNPNENHHGYFAYAKSSNSLGLDIEEGKYSVFLEKNIFSDDPKTFGKVEKLPFKYMQTTMVEISLAVEQLLVLNSTANLPTRSTGQTNASSISFANSQTKTQLNSSLNTTEYYVDGSTDSLSFWLTPDQTGGDIANHSMELVSPSGNTVDSTRAKNQTGLGFTQNVSAGYAIYYVEDPEPGNWTVRTNSEVDVEVNAPVMGAIKPKVSTLDSTFQKGDEVPVTFSVNELNTYTSTNINAHLEVAPEDGNKTISLGSVNLSEQGQDTYEGSFVAPYAGSYSLVVDFASQVDGESVRRRSRIGIAVEGNNSTQPEPPSAPEDLSGEYRNSQNEITLSWTHGSTSNISEFQVYRDTIPNPTNKIATLNGNKNSYADANISKNTTYYYRLTAVNTNNIESEFSEQIKVELDLAAPKGLEIQDSDNGLQLSWGQNTTSTVAKFVIFAGSDISQLAEQTTISGSKTSYTIADTTNRFFGIKAENEKGNRSKMAGPVSYIDKQQQISDRWKLIGNSIEEEVELGQDVTAYTFDYTYKEANILSPATGSWVKARNGKTLDLRGPGLEADSMQLSQGWNLIGSLADTASVRDPNGILNATPIYLFDSEDRKYNDVKELHPSKGHWIYATDQGKVYVSIMDSGSSSAKQSAEQQKKEQKFDRITFSNSGTSKEFLYARNLNKQEEKAHYLPPKSPKPSLDVRTSAGYGIGQGKLTSLELTSNEYPVQVTINSENKGKFGYQLIVQDGENITKLPLLVDQSQEIKRNHGEISLKQVPKEELITENDLAPNYPNPFNPTTTIRYEVSQTANVRMVVYNVLGRRVRTLIDQEKQPGAYTVRFDGSNLASGIYYLRLKIGDFTELQKMTLIK